jgi:serine/threonine protein kinase
MPMTDRIVAGRYRLTERIGVGGMGRVWLADDDILHRKVAVKEILLPEALTKAELDELRLRTLREARTAARLTHPNVVRVYDVLFAGDRPWIVMEYVASRSLAQVVRDDRTLTPRETAQVGIALVDALTAAHDAGVLHRDIKPGNVLLADDGRVMLTDFGLATFDEVGVSLTQSGIVHGSPQFIAPERALDGTSSAAADMWSLGATLYAAVEGRSPYSRPTSYEILSALATADPDPMVYAGPLARVLNGLLRRDPQKRMPAAEMRARLQRIVELPERDVKRPIQPSERLDGPSPRSTSGESSLETVSGGGLSAPSPQRHRIPPERISDELYSLSRINTESQRFSLSRRLRRTVLICTIAVAMLILFGLVALKAFSGPKTVHLQPAPSAVSISPTQGQGGPGPTPTPPPPPRNQGGGQGQGGRNGPPGRPVPPPPWMCRPAGSGADQAVPTIPPPAGAASAPSGWIWTEVAGSYRIALPPGFTMDSNGQVDCFYASGDPRVISVNQWTDTTDNPVTAATDRENQLISEAPRSGYQPMPITKRSCRSVKCAGLLGAEPPSLHRHLVHAGQHLAGSAGPGEGNDGLVHRDQLTGVAVR